MRCQCKVPTQAHFIQLCEALINYSPELNLFLKRKKVVVTQQQRVKNWWRAATTHKSSDCKSGLFHHILIFLNVFQSKHFYRFCLNRRFVPLNYSSPANAAPFLLLWCIVISFDVMLLCYAQKIIFGNNIVSKSKIICNMKNCVALWTTQKTKMHSTHRN